MTFRLLSLPPDVPGRIWLASMPGRSEPWPAFLDEARRARLDFAVCLNPLDEITELSPSYHQAIVGNTLPFRWLHLPMNNFGLAQQLQAFRGGVEQVTEAVQRGESVLIHCAAGIGRTGSLVACVLKNLGAPRDEALAAVRAAGSSPESAVQTGLVDGF